MNEMKKTPGAVVKYEAEAGYSRDEVTVASGQTLAVGDVVALDANGKAVRLDPAASDSRAEAVGMMVSDADASGGDVLGIMIARHAIVADAALGFSDAVTAKQKATAIDQLKARGILARKTV